ncbi:MAG TPA: PLP-dependent aminotransferase family protein [Phycisphaerae bacterium]|nr:PLP-dependent aminotransferase family protein [Phycisphaerae bacterium]
MPGDKAQLLSAQALRTESSPINYLMALAFERPDAISLAAGFVDNESLPVTEMLACCREMLSDPAAARAALQYGTTQGHRPLRERLIRRLVDREGPAGEGMALDADHVVLTSGSQQMLFLICSVLLDPDDIVLLPRPAYFVFMDTLRVFGARTLGIDMDAEGLRADHLDRRLTELDRAGELGRVKFLYVCSYCDSPTGLTLSASRRRELMEVVARWRRRQQFYVLEDAAYRDLVYDAQTVIPSLKSLDRGNASVIYLETFSKPLAPGLKTGYGILPTSLVAPVLDQKGSHDFGSANLCQHLICRLLDSGRADEHLRQLHAAYRPKRDALLGALDREMSGLAGVSWTRPLGGLYVWLTLPTRINTDLDGPLFKRCLDKGVLYVPGSACYQGEPGFDAPRNHIRLSFGVPTPDENREGVRRLAQALREEMA